MQGGVIPLLRRKYSDDETINRIFTLLSSASSARGAAESISDLSEMTGTDSVGTGPAGRFARQSPRVREKCSGGKYGWPSPTCQITHTGPDIARAAVSVAIN